ncbi:MAG: DUF1569 domain-containing protein [Bacteroidia bacterium]
MIHLETNQGLKAALLRLKADAAPNWGRMSPQHVIEHLSTGLKVSTGKLTVKHYLTLEEAEELKKKIIFSDAEIPQGIKNPTLGDEPPALRHASLAEALNELYDEIDHFNAYYKTHPQQLHTHPRMGQLGHAEWLIFHNKHFTHHFKQYSLI